jgi:peptidyl-prolyl isomerase E (cyclophilin E)
MISPTKNYYSRGKKLETMSSQQTPTLLQSRRALYIGGLDAAVKENVLRAAFIPFGPIQHIEMPMDYAAGTHKGFAFLEYIDGDDAAEAIYNMDGAELYGKSLTVNIAQAEKINLGGNKAVWSTEEWFKEQSGVKEEEDRKNQGKGREIDASLLKE